MTAITEAKSKFYLASIASLTFGYATTSQITELVNRVSQACLNEAIEAPRLFTKCGAEVVLTTVYLASITALFGMTAYYGYELYQQVTYPNKTS